MSLAEKIKSNPGLKKLTLWLITSEAGTRPRWWVRTFVNPFYHKKGKNTRFFGQARIDTIPFNHFETGEHVTIEDFTFVNNGMGRSFLKNVIRKGSLKAFLTLDEPWRSWRHGQHASTANSRC